MHSKEIFTNKDTGVEGPKYSDLREGWMKGFISSVTYLTIDRRDTDYRAAQKKDWEYLSALAKDYPNNNAEDNKNFRNSFFKHKAEMWGEKERLSAEFDYMDKNVEDDDPIERAVAQYYAILDDPANHMPHTDDIVWTKVDAAINRMKWSPEQVAAVGRTRYRGPYPKEFLLRLKQASPTQNDRIQDAFKLRVQWLVANGHSDILPLYYQHFTGILLYGEPNGSQMP
jgi:hypothetical protein